MTTEQNQVSPKAALLNLLRNVKLDATKGAGKEIVDLFGDEEDPHATIAGYTPKRLVKQVGMPKAFDEDKAALLIERARDGVGKTTTIEVKITTQAGERGTAPTGRLSSLGRLAGVAKKVSTVTYNRENIEAFVEIVPALGVVASQARRKLRSTIQKGVGRIRERWLAELLTEWDIVADAGGSLTIDNPRAIEALQLPGPITIRIVTDSIQQQVASSILDFIVTSKMDSVFLSALEYTRASRRAGIAGPNVVTTMSTSVADPGTIERDTLVFLKEASDYVDTNLNSARARALADEFAYIIMPAFSNHDVVRLMGVNVHDDEDALVGYVQDPHNPDPLMAASLMFSAAVGEAVGSLSQYGQVQFDEILTQLGEFGDQYSYATAQFVAHAPKPQSFTAGTFVSVTVAIEAFRSMFDIGVSVQVSTGGSIVGIDVMGLSSGDPHKQQLIVNHQRRLRILRDQQSRMGTLTPPYILTEIEDIEVKIRELADSTVETVVSIQVTTGMARQLITQRFNDAELRRFMFDNQTYKPVYHELSSSMGKTKIIQRLIEFAERKLTGGVEKLLKDLGLK